jgi:hypothetical protein
MKKYPRTYHIPTSPGSTSDDRFLDSVDQFLNNEIVITEKLDGSNTSITKDGVYGRSHADFTRNSWDQKSWELWNFINTDLSDGVYLFGEGMYGIHSIEYSDLESYFYLFGVRDNGVWLSWDEVEEYSYILSIPTVPVLFKGIIKTEEEFNLIVDRLVSEESGLGGKREGIVIRNANSFNDDVFSRNVGKWVRKDHVTTDIHWTKNWKKAKIKYE